MCGGFVGFFIWVDFDDDLVFWGERDFFGVYVGSVNWWVVVIDIYVLEVVVVFVCGIVVCDCEIVLVVIIGCMGGLGGVDVYGVGCFCEGLFFGVVVVVVCVVGIENGCVYGDGN